MNDLCIDVRFSRKGFGLDVAMQIPGEGICVLLGPSGSGKTTLMRLVAGLEKAEAGVIAIGNRTWLDTGRRINVPVRQRRAGIVFQDYALFPNMTVAQNIGYGVAKSERADAVAAWLERLDLGGLAQRYPDQLSGGQRQRVALARTLATDPDLLLLDEPFSAVDAHLRQNLRSQLMGIVAAVKKPALMVTHDLEEARQLADTVGVITQGRLARFGATRDVFDDPGDYAAASVLGWRNLLPLDRLEADVVSGPWGRTRIEAEAPVAARWLGIRGEHVGMGAGPSPGMAIEVRAVRVRELGAVRELQCRLPDNSALFLKRPWDKPLPAPGEAFHVHFPMQYVRLLGEGVSLAGRSEQFTSPSSEVSVGPETPTISTEPRLGLV